MISSNTRELIIRALLAGLSVDMGPDDQFTAPLSVASATGGGVDRTVARTIN